MNFLELADAGGCYTLVLGSQLSYTPKDEFDYNKRFLPCQQKSSRFH